MNLMRFPAWFLFLFMFAASGCMSLKPPFVKIPFVKSKEAKPKKFKTTQPVQADVPLTGTAYRYYSPNRQFYIDMTPSKGVTVSGPGKGVARRADSNQVLWEVPWYSKSVALVNDGVHLIRVEEEGADKKRRDLGIGFYALGKEIKIYAVTDLIKNKKKIQKTLTTYYWLARSSAIRTGLTEDGKKYVLALVDGTVYTFDVHTGEIITTDQDLKARGYE
jgi:hypothetical protein